jgi:hypothetical protein
MKALEPLWQISAELQMLLDSVVTCEPELLPELEQRIARYLAGEAAKVDNIAQVFSSLDGVAANAKAEIERLRARQQSAEKAAERLEAYVLQVLRERDGRPLRGHNFTLSTRRSEALIIDDPAAVPDEWKRKTLVVDILKDPLKRAIRGGAAVSGVHLEPREHLVRK